MSNYRFRLQKLLNIRCQKEEDAKVSFKNAAFEKEIVENKLNNLNDKHEKFCNLFECRTVVEQKIRFQYLCALESSIETTEKELNNKTRALEEKRVELSERQIERKTVEILKEKGEEAFIREENYKEQKTIDELALYGFMRNMKGGEKNAG
jgi:flagellar protein FliJ